MGTGKGKGAHRGTVGTEEQWEQAGVYTRPLRLGLGNARADFPLSSQYATLKVKDFGRLRTYFEDFGLRLEPSEMIMLSSKFPCMLLDSCSIHSNQFFSYSFYKV